MLAAMRLVLWIVALGAVAFLLIQVVPYGRAHSNPRTAQEPEWNSPATRALTQKACFDCHSNQTDWPWYTNVAPVSWLATRDVDDGRSVLNFSEWQRPQDADLQDVIGSIREKHMPPLHYRLLHRKARLSDAERQQLELGLVATWTQDPPGR